MERILIVDDDITFGLMLKTWLSKKGFGHRPQPVRRQPGRLLRKEGSRSC